MKHFCLLGLLWMTVSVSGQRSAYVTQPAFEKKLNSLLNHSIREIDCAELFHLSDQYYLLDTRAYEEYEISHIRKSRWVGYDEFELRLVKDVPKNAHIVCYCSVGYRSEKIAEKLVAAGFQNVYNLYGGLFEWVNRAYPVVDSSGAETKKIHAYNRKWGKWMVNSGINKVY